MGPQDPIACGGRRRSGRQGGPRKSQLKRHDCLRSAEAGIDLPQCEERPNHQSGANQEHQRHCHLSDHEHLPSAMTVAAAGQCAAARA
jgi:hypothetical protein